MGNTNVVASGVKNQGNSKACKLYELVNLQGGGELVEITKLAIRNKDFTELDERIDKDVRSYLYNNGNGKYIPTVELVKIRNASRCKQGIKGSREKRKSAEEQAKIDGIIMMEQDQNGGMIAEQSRNVRLQCWDLDKRGTVGDTILHLCLLNATQVHADLAKRLLHFFPKMIDDIYVGEEYYGETILHLAIVNEDPAMVKFLIDKGADVNARVCGNFFTPDDQRDSRMDSLDHEWVDVCKETNYEGNVYWGDYPLSFAACLNLEECVRLLLAKGADPNKQDANGNTCMHILVIRNNVEMFDLLHSQGGKLDIKNRQNLTPLTLAAKLARKEMFDHILEIVREVYWMYGNVSSAGYPLTDVDTISKTGHINMDSALYLIVKEESDSHLEMMDGVIVKLLQDKWKTFVRDRFYRRFGLFILYFIFLLSAFSLRPGVDLCAHRAETSSLRDCDQTGPVYNRTTDPCYLLKAYRDEDIARLVLEVIVLLSAIYYIFLAMKEVYHQGFKIFRSTLTGAPAKTLFLISCLLVMIMLPCRATCAHEAEDVIGVLAVLCTAPYLLFFCRGFRRVGPSVVMIYNMIHQDLLQFFIIYVVFIIGFSQAIYIPFRDTDDPVFSHPLETVVGIFSMSVGDFDDLYEAFGTLESPVQGVIKVIFCVYMIMVTILLVNMLIAMMGRTYEMVTNSQKEWFRQWANIVLVLEQTVTTENRKEQMLKYSVPFSNDQRALMIRWHQSEKEQTELRELRARNKEAQKLLAQRKIQQLPTFLSLKTSLNLINRAKRNAKALKKTADVPEAKKTTTMNGGDIKI